MVECQTNSHSHKMTDGEGDENKEKNKFPAISRVAIRVPPFWKPDPQLWFCQIEAQFVTSNITKDDTKHYTAISSIESEVLCHVNDVLLNPPEKDKYQSLKQRLIEHFCVSEEARLKKLLHDKYLGDKRPSHFLHEMRSLAGPKIGSDLLKSLWLQRLPAHMQTVLTVSDDNLDKLAAMADRINDVSTNLVNSVEKTSSVAPNDPYINILDKIDNLTKRINDIQTGRSRPPYRFRSKSRNRPRSSSKQGMGEKLCWYHRVYYDKATKCRQPCSYSNVSKN